MAGNKKPNRERSGRGELIHKYKELKEEHERTKINISRYMGAVQELAKSATKSSRRVGMLTQVVVALRKHVAYWPHDETCAWTPACIDGDIDVKCDCGHDAILASVDQALAEPDFDPEVRVEIKDPVAETANVEIPEFVPPPSRL